MMWSMKTVLGHDITSQIWPVRVTAGIGGVECKISVQFQYCHQNARKCPKKAVMGRISEVCCEKFTHRTCY